MSTQRLTDWFPGDVKPVRVGVYERSTSIDVTHFSKWDGSQWRMLWHTVVDAYIERKPSTYQDLPWRGLSADPLDPFANSSDEQTDDHTGICEVSA